MQLEKITTKKKTKFHEPVGWVQSVVLNKIKSSHLFQIAQEKSSNRLLFLLCWDSFS